MKKTEELFADYLEGKITLEELKERFEVSPQTGEEFEELRLLYESLPEEDSVEVSTAADNTFYSYLEDEKMRTDSKKSVFGIFTVSRNMLKYAAMLAAVGTAYYLGIQAREAEIVEKPVYVTQVIRDTVEIPSKSSAITEKKTLKKNEPEILEELAGLKKEMNQINEVQHKMILAMLHQESAASRIEAINYSYALDMADNSLMTALLKTLEADPSVNVRLAALNAIGRFNLSPQIRENMVYSLAIQDDPTLQIALINKLIELRELKALPVFAGIADDPDISENVKNQAELGIKVLNM
jgi:hypothetical protein